MGERPSAGVAFSWLIIIGLAISIVIVGAAHKLYQTPEQKAVEQAQRFILTQALTPATVKFLPGIEVQKSVSKNCYHVYGGMDGQDSRGLYVRGKYWVHLEFSSKGLVIHHWNVESRQ